jgi:hypothetical protein
MKTQFIFKTKKCGLFNLRMNKPNLRKLDCQCPNQCFLIEELICYKLDLGFTKYPNCIIKTSQRESHIRASITLAILPINIKILHFLFTLNVPGQYNLQNFLSNYVLGYNELSYNEYK